MVERQGRHPRHFVLLDEPVAGRALAPEASRGAVHLGGLVGLLPRALPPRRHSLRFPPELVRAGRSPPCSTASASADAQQGHRRAGRGARRCSEDELAGIAPMSTRTRCVILSPTTTTAPARRNSMTSTCRCSRPPTGAAWACTRAAISRATSPPARSRNGWRCTATRTSRFSTASTGQICRGGSSAISSRARTPAGTSSPKSRSISAVPAKSSTCAPRTNGRSPARNGPGSISMRTTAA